MNKKSVLAIAVAGIITISGVALSENVDRINQPGQASSKTEVIRRSTSWGNVTIDFETYPDGTVVSGGEEITTEYSLWGVRFDSVRAPRARKVTNVIDYVSTTSGRNSLAPGGPAPYNGGTLILEFDTPVSEVGSYFVDDQFSVEVKAYDGGGNVVGTASSDGSNTGFDWWELSYASGISRVEMAGGYWSYPDGPDGWCIDDLTYVSVCAPPIYSLVALEITGPNEVAEDFGAQYKATAYYDDGNFEDVTDLALWSVEPNDIASVDAGLLQTQELEDSEEITIYAQYTEGDITVDANKPVWVFEICRRGSALEFDGLNDYVELSDNAVKTTEFTVAAWGNHYGLGGGHDNQNRIFSQRDDSVGDNHPSIGLVTEFTDYSPYAVAVIRSSSGYAQYLRHPKKDYNEWHHYAMTVDSNDFIFYIDGVEVEKAANMQAGDYVTSIDHVSIGRHQYGGADEGFFNGAIDDLRVYDRALSAEEIWAGMYIPLSGGEPNLVGYWDFDEGEGQVVYDMSGNGNDGQLGSGPDIDDSDPNWVDSNAPLGICNPPFANAGPDQTVYVDSNCMTLVTFDGSDSNDPDGDELTYYWFMDGIEIATGVSPTIELSLGEYVIELIVNDGFDDSEPDEVVITVLDSTAPEFSLAVEPNVLWPANHEMVLITVEWEVGDNCDDEPEVSLVSITSSEEDDGKGDGATSDDIVIGEDGSIYLRAESVGYLEGRVYTITYEAVDDSGNATIGSAEVVVPDGYRWRHLEHKGEGAEK